MSCIKLIRALALTVIVSLPGAAFADTILVDFGDGVLTTSPTGDGEYWNNVTSGGNYELSNLVRASDGASTTISLVTTLRGLTSAGTQTPDPSLGYPASAASDAFWDNEPTQVVLSGLDATGLTFYDFTFFASRMGVADVRQTQYLVTGGNGSGSDVVTASDNTSDVAVVAGITANNAGEIIIDVTAGPDSESINTYLNVMEITTRPIPEPASLALLGLGGLTMLRRRRSSI